jgi:diacylglycerol kinase family enzyme
MNKNSILAARQVLSGQPRRVDIGRLQDARGRVEYWDNTVGLGFDTTVTIRSRNIPVVRGFLIYLIAVLQTILLNHEAPCLKVTTDQEAWDEEMLMLVLCNGGREGGGFMVSPQARPDDGVFHYTGIRRVSRPMMLRLLPEVMKGTHGRFRQVRMGTFRKMEVHSDRPLYIHTDGEIFAGFGVDVRDAQLEIMPGALEVVA